MTLIPLEDLLFSLPEDHDLVLTKQKSVFHVAIKSKYGPIHRGPVAIGMGATPIEAVNSVLNGEKP